MNIQSQQRHWQLLAHGLFFDAMSIQSQQEHWQLIAHGLFFEASDLLPKALRRGTKMAAAWCLIQENPGIAPRALRQELNESGRNVTQRYANRIIEILSKLKLIEKRGATVSTKLYVRQS